MRGSDWHQWDLHIHTPKSFCSDYGGDTQDVWDKFINELEQLPSSIKVIGINDYLFLDGYEKVLAYQKQGRLKNIELILPVIEFRIKQFAGSSQLNRINYHIIFADEKILPLKVIKAHFLTRLTAMANLDCNNSNNFTWGGVVTEESLRELGKHIDETTPTNRKSNKSHLELGFDNINFDLDKIANALGEGDEPNLYLQNKYFKAIGKSEWDSFRWDGSIVDKKTIINNAHFVFSASPSEENARKGINSLKENEVNYRLIHCSDSHQFCKNKENTSPKELGHCYTWIKSDLTFEGLRQVLYEPDLRKKIQKENPNNKRLDKIIKSIRFTSNNLFTSEEIHLNPYLNSVIGGKSSGKSLLLYYIANTINYKYASKQINPTEEIEIQEFNDIYKFSDDDSFDFTVKWEDGVEYRLKDNLIKDRPFIYIPQSYIVKLTENIEKNSRYQLGEFIRGILLQEKSSNEIYHIFKEKIKILTSNCNDAIREYIKIKEEIDSLRKQKNGIGDNVGIQNQIIFLSDKVNNLQGNSISQLDLNKYNILNKHLDKFQTIETTLSNDLSNWEHIAEKIKSSLTVLASEFNEVKSQQSSNYYSSLYEKTKVMFNELWNNFNKLDSESESIQSKLMDRIQNRTHIITGKLNNYHNKLINKNQIKSLEDEIKIEKNKLTQIAIIEQKIKIQLNLLEQQKALFFQIYLNCHSEYETLIKELNQKAALIEDIELIGSVKFNYDSFKYNFFNVFDQRTSLTKDISLFSDNNSTVLDININYEEKKKLFDLIISNQLICRKYKTLQDGLFALFNNDFYDCWELKIGHDEMANMSPGKANLAILKLLIELSEENCPILIDQPEDNLDNRSIYSDLVQFIRKRKDNRQLIIVTHNPNIVVGSDSENVIVANQKGQDSSRENNLNRFNYINGSLENTFLSNENTDEILLKMGIREHVTDILEGGKEAFTKREKKYGFY